MFEQLPPQLPDKIVELMSAFREDPRATKVDLGIGVYSDASGHTPIMGAIKEAEHRLLSLEDTKTYTHFAGDAGFRDAMVDLILKNSAAGRIASAATPGGTGALRHGLEMTKKVNPDARIWISDPTWPNHPAIIDDVGLQRTSYRYFDHATNTVDPNAMIEDLSAALPGDIVILHGCCHNPSGANLTNADWHALSDLFLAKGLIPFIDLAYQGFGDGLEEDAYSCRLLADTQPEVLIAASCSKNFGVYRDRAGCLITVTAPGKVADAQSFLIALNRLNFSFPPDHGTRLVDIVLNDPQLKANWMAELEAIRLDLIRLREGLADALKKRLNSDRFDFIANHRGMFSLLGLSPEQIQKLRSDHGVYVIGDGRMNVAGLSDTAIPHVAEAIADVL